MPWIFGIYPNYEQARAGSQLLLKEKVANKSAMNVIITENVALTTKGQSQGAYFREITGGDAQQEGFPGNISSVQPLDTEQLPWLDHFLADRISVSFADVGAVICAGNLIQRHVQEAISSGATSLAEVIKHAGVTHDSVQSLIQGIQRDGILFWIPTAKGQINRTSELMRANDADPVIVSE